MIIQCEKCRTRFRLDDSKISESGVRVRCSRCTHTFIIRRDAPEEETDFDSILQGLGNQGGEEPEAASGPGESETPVEPETPAEPETPVESAAPAGCGISAETGMRFEPEIPAEPEVPVKQEIPAEPELPLEPDWAEGTTFPEWAYEEQASDVGDGEPDAADAAGTPQQGIEDGGQFAGFLGKGVGLPHFQVSADSAAADDGVVPEGVVSGFSADAPDMEKPSLELEMSGGPSEVEEISPSPFAVEKPDVGRIPDPVERRWPVADGADDEAEDNELPPLSIASRRKGLPFFPILLGLLFILVLGASAFYLMRSSTGNPFGFLPDSARKLLGVAGKDAGGVAIRSLDGAFLENREAGQLFVMRGEVFNASGKPFSALQVKGTVYGAKGEVLAQRTVFCGNTFSREQLAFESFSSMEKAMGRQFGDTLANLEVLPGKGVPFVIVFRNLPKGATDYAATVAGHAGMGSDKGK